MQDETTPPTPQLEASWLRQLGDEFQQPYMAELRAFLLHERERSVVHPPGRDMFNAFALTPFEQVRVVILGQDPYHGPDQAHGLCFSVRRGQPPPPSLVNIFEELRTDLGLARPAHGELTSWAQQGVLLLNTCLSVRAGQAASHQGKGWERLTDAAIRALAEHREGLVFVLWGAPAGKKAPMIDASKHLILKAPHPSPLSAYRGFFGCRHFSRINAHVIARGSSPIDWQLPE